MLALSFFYPRRVSPFLAWADFTRAPRFARSTIPEEKWGTTRSLNCVCEPKNCLKMYARSWEVTMIFQRGRGDTVSYPGYTVLARLSFPHAVFCFKKATLLWEVLVSVGEEQAHVNESRGTGEGPNMLSSPYKPNFGQKELLASIVWYEEIFNKVSLQKVDLAEHLEKRWPR